MLKGQNAKVWFFTVFINGLLAEVQQAACGIELEVMERKLEGYLPFSGSGEQLQMLLYRCFTFLLSQLETEG